MSARARWLAPVGAAAFTAAVVLPVAAWIDPTRTWAVVVVAGLIGAAHAAVWPPLLGRKPGPSRASIAVAALLAAVVAWILVRLPSEALSIDRFAGGPSIGIALFVLPSAAAVAALAALDASSDDASA